MFPNLTPVGIILKLNREPMPELGEEVVKADHDFWSKYSAGLIGDWMVYDTPVKDVVAFAEKVYLRHDLEGFSGDADFVHDRGAQRAFSKLRSSSAGIYSWRMGQPPSGGITPARYITKGENRKLMEREADFGCKQAFAFCPGSPEAVFRYVQLLIGLRRLDDALLVAQTGREFDATNSQFSYLIEKLNRIKDQSGAAENIKSEIPQLERAVAENPTNFTQQFELAQDYFKTGQSERGYEVLDRVLHSSRATTGIVISVADAYNRLGKPLKLQDALEKLTEMNPDSPEAWFDLAALRASLGKSASAIETLKKSLDLNARRLVRDPKAHDIREPLAKDKRFDKLRDLEAFKAMLQTP
jgi:thioredoxin-like negative regulator of GroEL